MNAGPAPDLAIDESLRRRFEAAWRAGEPLPIEDCLPPRDSAAYLPTLEELVCIELEFAWKSWSAGRASQTWMRDSAPTARPPLLEQYLQRFESLNQPQVVARLAQQEFLARTQFGDRPEWEEYRRRFGELAALPDAETIQARRDRHETSRQPLGDGNGDTVAALPARRFGNYELLDELGRGGMGVVYRARQLSADRIVALKVIRSDQLIGLSARQRAAAVERFHHESLATARLAHEHIVTVYEVGEVNGEPFFSMRYVEGQSLAELLRARPIEGRRAAAYLESVARAVAAAHEAGILHRDLKPQNILVEARSDRALVADFGLAKLLEQPSELTRAGEVMGTPAYMSPEQARDSSQLTVRSDLYSLGATLYHMLVGRAPFQAATAVETLRQVQHDAPAAPSRLNRAVDRDLETICLTCLQKEPQRRYASAAALADELARYRGGFPILARPAGPVERSLRWCRRNPVLAGAIALAATFLAAALVATSVGYATTSAALAGKTRALQESERSYQQSREVVNQFFTLVSEDVLLNQPGAQPLRSELLQLALKHYQRFLAERGTDPALLEEIARTHYRVALIQQAIQPEAAAGLPSLEEALRIQRELLAASPANMQLQEALGDTLNALGQAHQSRSESKTALTLFEESRQFRQRLADRQASGLEPRRKLANTVMNVGLIQKQLSQFDQAARSLDDAQKGRQAVLQGRRIEDANSQELLVWRDLARGHYNQANLLAAMKGPAAAEEELPPAIAILEQIRRMAPSDLRNRERLAGCYHLSARLRYERGDLAESSRRYEQAIAVLDDLHRDSPQMVEFQERLALVQMDYGRLQRRRGNLEAALAAYTRACELLQPLVPPPDGTEHSERRRNYAVALRERARAQIDLRQPADAEVLLQLSEQYLTRLVEQAADAPSRKRFESDLDETRRLRESASN